MKNKLLLLLLVSFTIFVSCNGKKEEGKEEAKQVDEFFSVDVEALASKSDDFTLFFSEDNTVDFKDINAVWKGINGGKVETLQYIVPEQMIPTHIRLDFGLKQNQDSVVVKNVKINYYGNSIQFTGAEFFNYFIKDEQFLTKTDPAAGTLTILAKEGIYKTPYFYPRQELVDAIKKLTTSK